MLSKNYRPSQEDKNWLKQVAEFGSVVSREGYNIQVHHPIGRLGKGSKLLLGPKWILPLTRFEHELLHSDRKAFEQRALGYNPEGRFDAEKTLYFQMIDTFREWGMWVPEDHFLDAIRRYRR